MGSLLKIGQGIKIKTTQPPHHTAHGVERESRVKAPGAKAAIKLGVRIGAGQNITWFKFGTVDMFDGAHPYDTTVQDELNGLPRFQMAGETWKAWTVQAGDLPTNMSNFSTEFALDHPDTDGQTVMWAVVYAADTSGYAGDHVFVGYADVTPP